jgi:hypothetical protein
MVMQVDAHAKRFAFFSQTPADFPWPTRKEK